jgi:hypothetical protein
MPYVELGPFDMLAWQLLWVVGLFFGQRFHGGAPVLHMSRPVQGVLLMSASPARTALPMAHFDRNKIHAISGTGH